MIETPSSTAETRPYRFGGYLVDPVRRQLFRDGEAVPVTPKALSILLVLLERRGEVVEKDELIRRIWPDTFVTEANLTQNVSALRKALGERANDHRYVVTVPGRGYSFVAELGERAPSSQEMPIVSVPRPAAPAVPRPVRRWGALAAALALLAAAAGALLVPREPAAPRRHEPRPSIAVLGFKNLSGSPSAQWLAPALAEMLTTELAAGGAVRVVSGENVARARRSPDAGSLDEESLRRLHRILGCDLLVTGSYLPLRDGGGTRIRLDLRVVRMPGGEAVASLAQVGAEPELFELVARTGGAVRQKLGLAGLSRGEARAARALQPGSPEAARLYAEGLARLRAFDTPRAVDLLRRAAAADPGSALIRSALAQAWSALGYDARARQEAVRAVELSASLPRPERLAIEAPSHQVAREWARASEIYRTLWTFYPDDLEHGLRLARSLSEGGRGAEAMATIAELRRLPAPAGKDPRIDLVEAEAALRLFEPSRILEAARRAEQKGRALDESLVVALALRYQGTALMLQGDGAAAIRLFQQARTLFREAGDTRGVASAVAHHGITLHRQGDLAGAERLYLETLQIIERLGNVSDLAAQLGNLGILYQNQGDLERALSYLERSRAQFAEIDDAQLESRVLSAGAAIFLQRADLEAARSRYEEVLALSRRAGSRVDEGRAFASLAAILLWKGEIQEADRLSREAFQILRGLDLSQSATALAAWADTSARKGDLAAARQRLGQALKLKRQVGDRIGAGHVLRVLAQVEHRAGDLAAARERSREQLRIAAETGAHPLRFPGHQMLGRVELAAGNLAAARRSLESALKESAAAGEHLRTRAVEADLARMDLAEGRLEEAARRAGETAGWCRQRGIPLCEALSLSVLCEALAEQGRGAEARVAAERIRVLIRRGEDRDLVLAVTPGLARAEAAGGNPQEALRRLEQAAGEAGRLGFVAARLEARLAAGEIRLERGDPAGRGELGALRDEAAARGFRFLARRAEAALGPSRS